MSTDKKLVELERDIRSMHQPHMGCPSHELAYNEDDFQRIFGAGDEQPPRRASIYRELDDSGHSRSDFE